MSLTQDDVLRLAKLARLQLTKEEIGNYTLQMDDVLHYLDKLKELKDRSSAVVLDNVITVGRPDEVEHFTGRVDLLKSAPVTENDLLVVPPVFSPHK